MIVQGRWGVLRYLEMLIAYYGVFCRKANYNYEENKDFDDYNLGAFLLVGCKNDITTKNKDVTTKTVIC